MLFLYEKQKPEFYLNWRYSGVAIDKNNFLVYFFTNSVKEFYRFKNNEIFSYFKFIDGKKNEIYDALKMMEL